MSYGLDLDWGGPIGDYIGVLGGPIKGYTTNVVQGRQDERSISLLLQTEHLQSKVSYASLGGSAKY